MVEEGNLLRGDEDVDEEADNSHKKAEIWGPFNWVKVLATEMHWSFVFGVVVVYGINQGFGGSLNRVGTEYYMKDVQKVQPSESQIYLGITSIPWMVKPLWGLLTDVVPILGYRRRPYFIISGLIGICALLFLSMHKSLHIFLAVLSLTISSAAVAITDVTVDACVAQNSNTHTSLASDMQTLCSMSSSIGSLVGFSISGILVHHIGSMGVYGLLTIPAALVLLLGTILKEPKAQTLSYEGVQKRFVDASNSMWMTLKLPQVWRPCLYMYLSLALSLNITEGMFFWYTDSSEGPKFSKEFVGYIFSIGSVGSLLGVILYQYTLKDHQFRDLCFWAQLLFGLSGMLDLLLVLRLNLKLGISDHFFAVIDEGVYQLIGRLKWMPLLVLSAKICPPGIEGTFFALLMSIDNIGLSTSSWLGGFLLHVLRITRTEFHSLWFGILVRNFLRLVPLAFLFLIPRGDPNTNILTKLSLSSSVDEEEVDEAKEDKNIELVALVDIVHCR
ncbi:hypothetical protein V2J09_010856 [Rumex salicifolius]